MRQLPDALRPLAERKQFLLFRIEPDPARPGKTNKFPCDLSGTVVDAHNPANWSDIDSTIAAGELLGLGVAFVLTKDDPFFCLDIDGCVINGDWSSTAYDLINRLAGCAVEVSASGQGLHIWGRYSGDEPDHKCKNTTLGLELYTSGRFIALGNRADVTGNAETVADGALAGVIETYFPRGDGTPDSGGHEWTTGPLPHVRPIPDDDELITKAKRSRSAASVFGERATFAQLWKADSEALADAFPDNGGAERAYDASSADAALAQHLAFWTGNDCERIERLMRRSGLARDKWNKHRTYLRDTITKACARQSKWYGEGLKDAPEPPSTAPVGSTPESVLADGVQLMFPDQQQEYFKGCVYIAEVDSIWCPTGEVLKERAFKTMFGGYSFSMDANNEKTTKNAWEAFTLSQAVRFPRANGFCFRPELQPGQLIESEGLTLVNTYRPVDVEMYEGDVTPFLEHARKLLPDDRDREILISYMAACVQYKGHKFQWAPLIQGVEGNGKTLFTRVVQYAIGERYTHMPAAENIGERFNSWLFNTLFVGVEDIYIPEEKRNVIETLKPMITNNRLARRAMQTDQTMHDVRCNFIFNTNHKDAIRKTTNDRRFCVFYTAQQDAEHLTRDGMTGDYFPDLYDWLRGGGYAMAAHFLAHYNIPDEFNPATRCQRAPETTSTREAVTASLGTVEQEILEAIAEGRPGFCGGWVSSFALDELISGMNRRGSISPNRRREIMKALGYDWHPNLRDGRVNNAILDGKTTGKPKLFIRARHPDAYLTSGVEIVRAYQAAQGYAI